LGECIRSAKTEENQRSETTPGLTLRHIKEDLQYLPLRRRDASKARNASPAMFPVFLAFRTLISFEVQFSLRIN
jgi:hypothetical protein